MSGEEKNMEWQLEWSPELSMDIPEIDTEHLHFIGLVNALNEGILARLERPELKRRLQAVVDDAIIHFAHEEALMDRWGYPALGEHEWNHAEIIQALRARMDRAEQGGSEFLWIETGLMVKQALIEHILTEDMKYRDYYQRKKALEANHS